MKSIAFKLFVLAGLCVVLLAASADARCRRHKRHRGLRHVAPRLVPGPAHGEKSTYWVDPAAPTHPTGLIAPTCPNGKCPVK